MKAIRLQLVAPVLWWCFKNIGITQVMRDRREVEPKRNTRFHGVTQTEVTLEDFDLVDLEEDGEEEEGGDCGD